MTFGHHGEQEEAQVAQDAIQEAQGEPLVVQGGIGHGADKGRDEEKGEVGFPEFGGGERAVVWGSSGSTGDHRGMGVGEGCPRGEEVP